jgi:hypothetical protein
MRHALNYENAAGAPASPPSVWPEESEIARVPGRFTLVMFAHPECPCTRASLAELDVLMARISGKVAASVRFRKPGAKEDEVRNAALWRKASSIPGVSPGFDGDDAQVARFGAQVSGQTLLYDPNGRLVFRGGITRARGHEGNNAGLNAVIRLVNGEPADAQARVFGCSLRNPDTTQPSDGGFAWKRR